MDVYRLVSLVGVEIETPPANEKNCRQTTLFLAFYPITLSAHAEYSAESSGRTVSRLQRLTINSSFFDLFRQICRFGTSEYGQRKIISSLDDSRTLLVQKLVTAIGAEELDLFMAKLLIVAIEFAFALWAGHPENFRHECPPGSQLIFTAETQSSPSSEYLITRKLFSPRLSAPPR